MKIANKFYGFLLLLLSSGHGQCYDVQTHQDISEKAVRVSNLLSRLPDFGLVDLKSTLPNNTHMFGGAVFCFEGFGSGRISVLDLIRLGAFCEDATAGTQQLARYTNHFYDPAHGGMGFLGIWPSSLTWGLEVTDIGTQDYSYKDAKDYLYKGLTLSSKTDRERNLGLTFRTLGHVMHLVEDLAQPQHTRNDSHAIGSLYEHYTNRDDIRPNLPFGGYSPVVVTTPDQFWHTADGKGLADYSNRGFVGAGTNFRGTSNNILPATNYPLPDGIGATVERKQITDPDLLGPVGPNQPLIGEMHFIATPVQDNYTGASDTNARTSTFSIIDSDLKSMGADMVFSLNRFNFIEAHNLLIPRAVGYSAGLINYFFRGQIDLVPDPDNPSKYVIKNLSNEKMTGTFALYYDDKDDQRTLTPNKWDLEIGANQSSSSLTLRPNPVGSPEPKELGQYMLVFNGAMGQEPAGSNTPATGAVTAKQAQDPLMLKFIQTQYWHTLPNQFTPTELYGLNANVFAPQLGAILGAAVAANKTIQLNVNDQVVNKCLPYGTMLYCGSDVYPFTSLQMDIIGTTSVSRVPYFILASLSTPTATVSLLVDGTPVFRFTFAPTDTTLNPPIQFKDTFHVDGRSVRLGFFV